MTIKYVQLNNTGTAVIAEYISPQDPSDKPGYTTIDDTDAKYVAWKNPQQPVIKAQLAALDTYISRGLEDYLTASAFDVTKLPAIQQQRLTQKQTLRAQLAALIAAGTP